MTKRILAIDDEEAVRDAFVLALSEAGYEVETASSGAEGVEKATRNPPALIFLDLRMPGMDGIATLRELYRCCPKVPVYIVTAFHPDYLDQLAQAAREGLRFGIASKPLTADQIRSIASALLAGPKIPG
ncbi:MAG: response regulator [Thiohalomonadaceae bacterium]